MPTYKINDLRFQFKESLNKKQDGLNQEAEKGKLFAVVRENCEIEFVGPKTRKANKNDVLVMEQVEAEYVCSLLERKPGKVEKKPDEPEPIKSVK